MNDIEERIRHIETILYDLALHLRRVPLAESTTRLHVRALELKRRLVAARTRPPDAAACEALVDELRELAREMRDISVREA